MLSIYQCALSCLFFGQQCALLANLSFLDNCLEREVTRLGAIYLPMAYFRKTPLGSLRNNSKLFSQPFTKIPEFSQIFLGILGQNCPFFGTKAYERLKPNFAKQVFRNKSCQFEKIVQILPIQYSFVFVTFVVTNIWPTVVVAMQSRLGPTQGTCVLSIILVTSALFLLIQEAPTFLSLRIINQSP